VTLFDDTITCYVKSCQSFVQRAVALAAVLFRQSLELLLKLFYVYFRPVTCSWTLLCAAGGPILAAKQNTSLVEGCSLRQVG
jgi:hypothetical protein